jgi:hypothetical protein
MLLLDEGVLIEIKSNAEADYVGYGLTPKSSKSPKSGCLVAAG